MNGRSAFGSISTVAPFGIAWVMSQIEARDHGEIGERHALRHDRVDGVQDERRRHDAARLHLVQHPGGRDAALGGIEHQHAADVAFAREFVLGRENTPLMRSRS